MGCHSNGPAMSSAGPKGGPTNGGAVVQASEEATKILYQLKLVLQGNTGPPSLDVPRPEHPEINVCNPTETEPLPEQVQALSDEVINKDLLPILADNLFRLDFEVLSYFIF